MARPFWFTCMNAQDEVVHPSGVLAQNVRMRANRPEVIEEIRRLRGVPSKHAARFAQGDRPLTTLNFLLCQTDRYGSK